MTEVQLEVERSHTQPSAEETGLIEPGIAITPALNPDFWQYRVMLTETQAVLGFWKFGIIGVGFAVEEDWNTNLPHGTEPEQIFDHIKHNKGDHRIPDEDVIEAIRLIDQAVRADEVCDCKQCMEGE